MSNDKQGTQFKKSVEMDSYTNPNRSQPIKNNKPEQNSIRNKKILKQRQKAKEELILKYGMSDREAEENINTVVIMPQKCCMSEKYTQNIDVIRHKPVSIRISEKMGITEKIMV